MGTRDRKAVELRERLECEKRQRELEETQRRRRSMLGQRPAAAGPVCARPQLTASVLTYNEPSVSRSHFIIGVFRAFIM